MQQKETFKKKTINS